MKERKEEVTLFHQWELQETVWMYSPFGYRVHLCFKHHSDSAFKELARNKAEHWDASKSSHQIKVVP